MTLTKLLWGAGLTAVAVGGLGVGSLAVGQVPASKPASTRKADPPPSLPGTPVPPMPVLPTIQDAPLTPEVPAPMLPLPLPQAQEVPPPERAGKSFTVPHPAGSFVREFADGERFAVRFDADRLYVEASFGDKAKPTSLSLEADYAMNKEGVVFGVITAAEYDGADTSVPVGRVRLRFVPATVIGEPFAFRVRVDEGTVTVKDARLGGVGGSEPVDSTDESRMSLAMCLNAVAGRYTASKEPVASSRKPGKPKLPKFSRPEPTEVSQPPVPIPSTVPSVVLPAGGPTLPTIPK